MSTRTATVFAITDENTQLPVVDVTNPIFAVDASTADLDALAEGFVQDQRNRPELPPPVRAALAQSILGKGVLAASGSYLSGMHTYLLKLGPDQLTDPFTEIDRRIAASFPAFATRIRLQDVARLLADGVSGPLDALPDRAVCLINIAGGPGADSWNALIHWRRERPGALVHRAIRIGVLDADETGPRFGSRAVRALTASGGPLDGLAVEFRHAPYDWTRDDLLAPILESLGARDAICAISSEGGLFEYGSDGEIAGNLAVLHRETPPDAIVAGSVTRDDEPTRVSRSASGAVTRPRTIDAFRRLVLEAGWAVDHVVERPFSFNVRLRKAG